MESTPTADTQPLRRKPFNVPVIFAPIFIPLLFFAGAVSYAWGYIQMLKAGRRERRFAEQMKEAGRLMHWQAFKHAEEEGTGTVIGEYLSMKGPFRLCQALFAANGVYGEFCSLLSSSQPEES